MKRYKLIVFFLISFSLSRAEIISVTPRGRVLIDALVPLQHNDSIISDVFLTDIRIGLKAKYEEYFAKLDIGFARNKVSVKDVMIGIKTDKHLFQIGQFYAPFSSDMICSSTDTYFLQPSSIGLLLGEVRELGLQYTYNTRAYNFTIGMMTNKSVSQPNNDGFSINPRFIYRPLINKNQLLYFAFALCYEPSTTIVSYYSPGIFIADTEQYSFTFENLKEMYKSNIELAFSTKQFGFRSELMSLGAFSNSRNYFVYGGFVEANYVLFGGRDQYDPVYGCFEKPNARSLQLVSRFNYQNSSNGVLPCMYDYSLGVNYYINKLVAIKLNYSIMLKDGIGSLTQIQSGFQCRIQASF